MKRIALVSMTLAAASVACGGGGSTDGTRTTPPATGRPSSTAKIAIVSPATGATVPTRGTTVTVSLEGGTIVKQASTNLKPDEGHVHLSVDGKTITLTGDLEVETGPLSGGPHLIEVEFAANDHGPFSPRVIAQVSVTAA